MITETKIEIYSRRMGQLYSCNRFTEYNIDIDLETDTDQLSIVLGNPGGAYTGIFSKFDPYTIFINDKPLMTGLLDQVRYVGDSTKNLIRIDARDVMAPLVDNDALPCTKYNIKPHEYITGKCVEYNIPKYVLDKTIPITKKLIIGTGESEISVMAGILVDNMARMWAIYDTVYMGKWDTNASPEYLFTRGISGDEAGIPVLDVDLLDSGVDMYSEYHIFGSMNDGQEKVVGIAKNEYLIQQGIKKRKTMRSSNNDSSSKYASNALENIRDGFKSGMELNINIPTKQIILPNKTARFIDRPINMNSIFFIKGVTYNKTVNGGSITSIKMIPGDVTFNIIWNNQGDKQNGKITGLPSMSLDALLKTRK